MSIYTPKNIQEAIDIASLLTNSQKEAQELIQCHAAFGDHFGGDLGKIGTQAYSLKGKPALTADAMAGICRRSGLVRFLQVIEWTTEVCVMKVARRDEPEEIVHTFVYTMEMATQQNLTRNRNWQTMPLQMLRVRCLTMALRATFPDAVSGIYSADEIADNMSMSDDERTHITAQAIGEEVGTQSPQPQPAPQSQRPQPQRAPQQSRPPQAQPPKMRVGEVTPSLTYNNPNNLRTACEFNEIPLSEANACMQRLGFHADKASAEERKQFFYEWLLSDTLRNSELKPNWWRNVGESKHIIAQLHQEFPSLAGLGGREIGQTLGDQFFWESVKIASCYSGDLLDTARVYIEQWSRQGANQLSPTTILGLAG
jgi:hypothetical protein